MQFNNPQGQFIHPQVQIFIPTHKAQPLWYLCSSSALCVGIKKMLVQWRFTKHKQPMPGNKVVPWGHSVSLCGWWRIDPCIARHGLCVIIQTMRLNDLMAPPCCQTWFYVSSSRQWDWMTSWHCLVARHAIKLECHDSLNALTSLTTKTAWMPWHLDCLHSLVFMLGELLC